MAVLLPTPHQEKEHQEKRRGYEKPRVEPGLMGAASPVQYVLRVTERKGLLFARKGAGRNGRREGERVSNGF